MSMLLAALALPGTSARGPFDMDDHFVGDALQTAAYEIRRRLLEKPGGLTTAEVEAVFLGHHEASVLRVPGGWRCPGLFSITPSGTGDMP